MSKPQSRNRVAAVRRAQKLLLDIQSLLLSALNIADGPEHEIIELDCTVNQES